MNEEMLAEALKAVQTHWPDVRPAGGMILGSGWSPVADAFETRGERSYADIPGMGATGVQGHAGRLVRAAIDDYELLIFQGRRHWYEGVGWTPIALPVYLLKCLGAERLVITNAAGAIAERLTPGNLMLIADHINLMGANPLAGPHLQVFGERFPDMTCVYDAALREELRAAAASTNTPLEEGVYLASAGPSYETPAEIRAFRMLGADAVGMSTAPEALLGRAGGLRIAGISCITNMAAGVAEQTLRHEEVVETADQVMPRMRTLLRAFWRRAADAETSAGNG